MFLNPVELFKLSFYCSEFNEDRLKEAMCVRSNLIALIRWDASSVTFFLYADFGIQILRIGCTVHCSVYYFKDLNYVKISYD